MAAARARGSGCSGRTGFASIRWRTRRIDRREHDAIEGADRSDEVRADVDAAPPTVDIALTPELTRDLLVRPVAVEREVAHHGRGDPHGDRQRDGRPPSTCTITGTLIALCVSRSAVTRAPRTRDSPRPPNAGGANRRS